MVQPYNYMIDVPDPSESIRQGFDYGRKLRAEEEQRQAAIQQRMQQEAFQQELTALSERPTAAEIGKLMIKYPSMADKFKTSFDVFDEKERGAKVGQIAAIFSAFESGKPEIGKDLVRQQAEAARNSGDEQTAKVFDDFAQIIDASPESAALISGALTSAAMGPKEFIDRYSKIAAERRETEKHPSEIKKMASELGLTNAQTKEVLARTKKLGVETAKAALELESFKQTGGVEPEEKFKQEEKIRKEWQDRRKVYKELDGTFTNIKESAISANGPGDIALITGFMKMLDPGSVVRETEFATARDTAGLFTQLQNRLEGAKNGQLLSPAQRAQYVALSERYLEAAKHKANEEKKDIGLIVRNYKLNPENIFGESTEALSGDQLPARATVGGQTYDRPANFSDAQWGAYLRAQGIIK